MTPFQATADHRAALDRVEALMDSAPGSAEEQALELWALLIENYEAKHQPVPPPDPIEAIRFRIDQLGLICSGTDMPTFIMIHYSAEVGVSEKLPEHRHSRIITSLMGHPPSSMGRWVTQSHRYSRSKSERSWPSCFRRPGSTVSSN